MSQHFFEYNTPEGTAFIYRSSAGSGKTFTLTKAYLKLVLRDTSRYHQIMAITFTNKAKDEMKSRIIEELTKLAHNENTVMREQILADFESEGVERIEDVITSRAKTVLNHLLHDYSRFNVSTIDHFFTQLIRHLAKELDLNLGYELDVDSATALSESIEILFKKADAKLLNWLKDFALDSVDNDKTWDIRKNINALGKKLFQESYLDIEDALMENIPKLDEFIKEQQQIVIKFKKLHTEQATIALSIAKEYNLTKPDFKSRNPYTWFEKLSLSSNDFSAKPSASFLNAISVDLWYKKDADRKEDIILAYGAGMGDAHRQIVEVYEGDRYTEFLNANAVLNYIHSYGVLANLAKSVQEYRASKNLIFISDSAFILNKAITNSETPFIYEKIGAKYNFILIDEFQDTSTYQWRSLLPFLQNAIASGGQLIIVGDVKQSIYGWRGGDMNLLLKQVEKDISVPEKNIKKLDKNYRSAKNIIEFNNEFFKLAAELLPSIHNLNHFKEEFALAYDDVEQGSIKDFDGLVEIKFFDDEDEQKWQDLSEVELKRTVENAIQDGFQYSDILILTRKTVESQRIASYLLSNNIPALSEAALKLTSSPKVQLVISSLKLLINPDDQLSRAELESFYNELSTTNKDIPQLDYIIDSLIKFKVRPVYETVEQLLLIFFRGAVDLYLQKLLDLCLAQIQKGNSSLLNFINWWLEQDDKNSSDLSLTTPESDQAILVLTIHKAKGLEKPIVILPFADSEIRPKSDVFWAKPLPHQYASWGSLPIRFNKNLADSGFAPAYSLHYFETALEALNLLYVAFTRAGERLYVFSNGKSQQAKTGSLITSVLANEKFKLQSNYNASSKSFIVGIRQPKASNDKKEEIKSGLILSPSTALSDQLIVDRQSSQLFMAINSEKSQKIREGTILHKVLSLISKKDDLAKVIAQLQAEGLLNKNEKLNIEEKLELLFNAVPQMKQWFSQEYEIITERPIFYKNKSNIPDRVMISGNEVIIVDYKREKESDRHKIQIKNYQTLLSTMGYKKIKMYLLYIDDQKLVEVV